VAKVDNNHTYTYDTNGNLVYVNTGRIKQDGALDSTAAGRKLCWDEENRLLASDDGGFVICYWCQTHLYNQRIVVKIGGFASYAPPADTICSSSLIYSYDN